MSTVGTIAIGVRAPIIVEGDKIEDIVVDSIIKAYNETGIEPHDGDIVGITESVVARAQGNYARLDEIAEETCRLFGVDAEINVVNPIYSRNRFAICLRGIARGAKKINIFMPEYDEVGNPSKNHPFTKMNYADYYMELCKSEGAEVEIFECSGADKGISLSENILIATTHSRNELYRLFNTGEYNVHTLCDYFPDRTEYGLLGSNKADDGEVKLFPNIRKARQLVYKVQERIDDIFRIKSEVFIYGDGAFKSPYYQGVSIWELADPVVCPAYTAGLEGLPNELKIKYLADSEYSNLSGEELQDAIKSRIAKKTGDSLIGDMSNAGSTPRYKNWLLGSAADLITGSGDKGCPFVLFHDYDKNYAQD